MALLIGVGLLAGSLAATPGFYTGLSLPEALDELRSQGLRILFSSALVRSDMRVGSEPGGASPNEVLEQLLRPHGLAVHSSGDGTLLVVPARLPASSSPRLVLEGTVRERDSQAEVPGVEIVLAESGRRTESGSDGSFALEGLTSGVYSLEASKSGFLRQRIESVRVAPGGLNEVEVLLLTLPTTLDEIEVVPQLEVGSIHSGTLLDSTELRRIPTPRDPWAVVVQTPGILIDRVNVGGSESGAQALFLAPGSSFEENSFSIDGVNTTDMAALGASTLYYDFDQFEQLRISTGGSDVRTATAGVAIRMITKRGSDAVRGSGRLLRTDTEGLFGLFEQGTTDISDKLAPGQVETSPEPLQGNLVDRILDYGLELGGPLVRDRLWGWGSYGFNVIDLITVDGRADDTVLENMAFKLNAQPVAGNSLVASFNLGDKRKDRRGAGPNRAPETTWRQSGPAKIYKVEDTHVAGAKLFLSASFNVVDGGFGLIPQAGTGPEGGDALLDAGGVWRNGFIGGSTDRDSHSLELESSTYFGRGDWNHTLDAGGTWRGYRYADDFRWPGTNQAYHIACENVGTCSMEGSGDLVYFERRGLYRVETDYTALWIQDTMTAGRWSLSAGLRFDLQGGRNPPGEVEANPALPDQLPALAYDGRGDTPDWASLAPRLSASYATDAEGRTLLRFSLGRFAEQLGVADVGRVNPLATSELLFTFEDGNGDRIWQAGEPLDLLAPFNFDPAHPLASPNRTDPDLEPELTDEVLVGVERVLSADWVLGLNFTYRQINDISEKRTLIRDGGEVRAAVAHDYVLERVATVLLPDGRPRQASFYTLDPALDLTGGNLLVNGGRDREYSGFALSFNRRPNDRWMMRGYVNWGEATWGVPADYVAHSDPTDTAGLGDNDGDLYAAQGRGLRTDVFLQSTWSAQWSGYYRFAPLRKWGFTLASNVFAREGYPIPYMSSFAGSDGFIRQAQVTDGVGEFRAADLFVVDVSIEKALRLQEKLEATLTLSAFNLFNESFVLRRERDLTGPRADFLDETMAPRVVRLGVRLTW